MTTRPKSGGMHPRGPSDDSFLSTGNESHDANSNAAAAPPPCPQVATLWVHDDKFSKEDVLIDKNLFGRSIERGALLEVVALSTTSDVRDFQTQTQDSANHKPERNDPARGQNVVDAETTSNFSDRFDVDWKTRCLCNAKL